MRTCVAVVVCAADGRSTPHDGRFVVTWNPHTRAGTLDIVTTDDVTKARRFQYAELMNEWRTVSLVQSRRPCACVARAQVLPTPDEVGKLSALLKHEVPATLDPSAATNVDELEDDDE